MRWSWTLEPRGVLKLMSPLVARMGTRQEETIWANLKQLLEGQATPPPESLGTPGGDRSPFDRSGATSSRTHP